MKSKKFLTFILVLVGVITLTGVVYAGASFRLKGFEFDPENHNHVIGKWQYRLGQADAFGGTHFGVLLSKNAPTGEVSSGGLTLTKGYAHINNTGGLQELGYDIRDGSHCGGGAPRFNVTGTVGTAAKDNKTYFIGCNSPVPDFVGDGMGWKTLRWGSADGSVPLMGFNSSTGQLENISGIQVKSLAIVFDEGIDIGNGFAILDNINIDGTMVSRPGSTDASSMEIE